MSSRLPPWSQNIVETDGAMPLLWRAWFEQFTAEVEAMRPGYGAALPAVAGQPDGRYFTLTTTQTLYQVQSGAWVAVDMVP
jgi:hypothetical protein